MQQPSEELVLAARFIWKEQQARPEQIPPDGDWLTWLIMSGRGWGKTRTGAEWLAKEAIQYPDTRWAVVAPTFGDARDTCVEGESGLQGVLNRYRMIHRYNRSMGEIELRNGSKIKLFSAEEPERLRGPQHHGAWCDEVGAWRYDDTWTQLQFGLRLGDTPRVCVTTTPKPRRLIKNLMTREGVVVTRGATMDNAANLSAAALTELLEQYEGTRTGRQELYGEYLEDVEGALWHLELLDDHRVRTIPEGEEVRTVVAIDPAVTSAESSAETGIVVATLTRNGHIYITSDVSMKGSPDTWARAAVAAYEMAGADCIVVEGNQGGDLHKTVLHTVSPNLPVKKVTATQGKKLRAEPVAALYEQGKVHHVGTFPKLEEQMTTWLPTDRESPDRLDALVWAVTELAFKRTVKPVQTFRT